jgi:hypothetical protein
MPFEWSAAKVLTWLCSSLTHDYLTRAEETESDTQVYYDTELITAIKSFNVQAPELKKSSSLQ